jgi:hypothetical protein
MARNENKKVSIVICIATLVFILLLLFAPARESSVQHELHVYPETLEQFAYRISPEEIASIVVCIIEVESNWQVNAVSKSGDYGLMQINKYWWSDTIDFDRIFEPEYNIKSGIHILEMYIDLSNGCTYNALRKYNGSSRYPHLINKKHKEKFGTELF